MAFTRIHDDPCRIAKEVQESTGAGRYTLNVPGNGDKPCYMEDPLHSAPSLGRQLKDQLGGTGERLARAQPAAVA